MQCSFYLEPVDGRQLPSFNPGQYLTFSVPIAEGRTLTRCYSLSDAPDPLRYRVTIKRIPAPTHRTDVSQGAASNFFHDNVRVGDVLRVKAPSGHFCIDTDVNVPAVFIAGGIGITPMMSMLRWCVAEQRERTLHLFYGVRNSEEHAFKQQLEEVAHSHARVHLNVIYSRPSENDRKGFDFQHAGHIDIALLQRTLPHGRHQFYVCGPPTMMESLIPALAEWGVPPCDIHYEAFGPASVRSASVGSKVGSATLAAPIDVQFRRSGRTLIWDGHDDSLLALAERHGVRVDFGCRSGSCGTCETRLVSGSVQYAHKPDHDVMPGNCLLCVAKPDSAVVLEA
jgi:uncharacterized protein